MVPVFKHAWVYQSAQTRAPGIDRSKTQPYGGIDSDSLLLLSFTTILKKHVLQLLGKLRVPICFSGLSFGRWELCRALGLGCNLHAAIIVACCCLLHLARWYSALLRLWRWYCCLPATGSKNGSAAVNLCTLRLL